MTTVAEWWTNIPWPTKKKALVRLMFSPKFDRQNKAAWPFFDLVNSSARRWIPRLLGQVKGLPPNRAVEEFKKAAKEWTDDLLKLHTRNPRWPRVTLKTLIPTFGAYWLALEGELALMIADAAKQFNRIGIPVPIYRKNLFKFVAQLVRKAYRDKLILKAVGYIDDQLAQDESPVDQEIVRQLGLASTLRGVR